ncbi:MAG: hypothetical protein OEL76_17760 [Siculibacillus sp.]|nr:hypothetical protein [Siculibacillus sp.]
MAGTKARTREKSAAVGRDSGASAKTAPSPAQRAYLMRGLSQPGGKLPLFDADGREVAHETIRVCIARGWAEPWFANPIKPDWIVAKLTDEGYRLLGAEPPARSSVPA